MAKLKKKEKKLGNTNCCLRHTLGETIIHW